MECTSTAHSVYNTTVFKVFESSVSHRRLTCIVHVAKLFSILSVYIFVSLSGDRFYYLLNGGQSVELRVNCRNRWYHELALYLPPNEFVSLGRIVLGRPTRVSGALTHARARAEALELESLFPAPSAAAGSSSSDSAASLDSEAASLRASCTDAKTPHNPLLLRPRAFTHALDAWPSASASSSASDITASCSSALNLRTMVY